MTKWLLNASEETADMIIYVGLPAVCTALIWAGVTVIWLCQ